LIYWEARMTHQGLSQAEYLNPEDARLADLVAVTSEKTEPGDYPRAAAVLSEAVSGDWPPERLAAELSAWSRRRQTRP
jgi:hypothetical protein